MSKLFHTIQCNSNTIPHCEYTGREFTVTCLSEHKTESQNNHLLTVLYYLYTVLSINSPPVVHFFNKEHRFKELLRIHE